MIKTCVVCGREFDAKGTAKRCSKECRLAAKRIRDRARYADPEVRAAKLARWHDYKRARQAAARLGIPFIRYCAMKMSERIQETKNV